MTGDYEGANEAERRELDRVGAFSDGVFAIAITLLVLNIEIPSGTASAMGSASSTTISPPTSSASP